MWDSGIVAIIAIGLFFSILFLQSSLDKIFNWKSNMDEMKEHFSKTIFKSITQPLLIILTLIELSAGLISAYGVLMLHFGAGSKYIQLGLELSILALLMLFFGQRIAKDYRGAETVAIYFAVAVISLLYLS